LKGLTLALALSQTASAQFNARGRGPRVAPPQASATRTPRALPAPGVQSVERDDALIARYRKLIVEQPGEEVPRRRLAELIRKRDGNLVGLLKELEAQAETSEDKYALFVAWGGILLEDGQKQAALAKLQAAQSTNQKRPEAHVLLASLYAELGEKEASRTSYERAARLTQGAERATCLRAMRDLSLDLGDFDAAKKAHNQLVSDAKGSLFLQGELGRELLRRGEVERAVSELERVARMQPGEARSLAPALRDLGQAQTQARKYDDAVKTLSRASKLAAASPGLRIMIDTLLAEAHRGRGTLPSFLEQLSETANTAPRLGLTGRLYEEQGQTNEAVECYTKALKREPHDLDLRLRLVRLLELTGQLEEALREYKTLVKASPGDVSLSLRYMEMLLAQGERKQVLGEFDRIVQVSKNDRESALLLLDFAERLGEKPRADRILARLSGQAGGDPQYLVELGSHFYRRGDEQEAKKIWKRILQVHRNKQTAHILYGEVLLDHEASEEGLEQLRAAVALDPDQARALRALALGLERQASQLQGPARTRMEFEALSHWKRIAGVRPTQAESGALLDVQPSFRSQARRHVVRLWKRSGRLAVELPPLARLLDGIPPDLDAGRLLTEGYLAAQRLDAAIKSLETIVRHAPGDRDSLEALERAYRRGGNDTRVLEVLRRLLKADPARSREYYERMAQAASRQNDPKTALKFAELGAAQNPDDPESLTRLGDLYLAQGQEQKAEVAYRSALKHDDRNGVTSLKVAEIVARSGRSPEALSLLSHVIRSSKNHEHIRRATRRALGLSLPLGETRRLEEVLRPLAIGRPEEPVYRGLLLEVLTAEMVPLLQRQNHGNNQERSQAERELSELAKRSTGPLLSALASNDAREQGLAIQLLSHAGDSTSATALLAFAEGSAPQSQKLLAVLSVGGIDDPRVRVRLSQFVIEDDRVQQGRLAEAALWALCQTATSRELETILNALKHGNSTLSAISALGLAQQLGKSASDKRLLNELLVAATRENDGPLVAAAATVALSRLRPGSLSKNETERLRGLFDDLARSSHPAIAQAALLSSARLLSGGQQRELLVEALTSTRPALVRTGQWAALVYSAQDRLNKGDPQGELRPLLPSSMTPEEFSIESMVEQALDGSHHLPERLLHSPDLEAEAFLNLEPDFREEARYRLRASRGAALSTLDQLSASSSGFVGRFLSQEPKQGLQKEAQRVAEECRRALLPEIKTLARGFDPSLAKKALTLLHPEDDPESLSLLERSLSHPSRQMQEIALAAISSSATLASLEIFERHEKNEPRWASRRRLAQALGAFKKNTQDELLITRADALLRKLESDDNPLVAEEARKSL
jgi:tetratricopeptide (TPR) repeat protein